MPPRCGKRNNNDNRNYKIAGELRRSQTITTFGSGAIVDLPRLSGIIAGIDSWPVNQLPNESKIHEQNLERLLGKDFFYQVSSPDTATGNTFGIPTYRFPLWYYCPQCHKLDYYKNISLPLSDNPKNNSDLYCRECSTPNKKVKLIPSRFVVACLNGHMEDFPYKWWAHKKKGKICENPKLTLSYKGSTGGLDSIVIRCETCEAENTMAGCMDKESLKGLHCSGNMPWLGPNPDGKGWYRDSRKCDSQMRVLQRSANNVYYPVNQSALTIPPWCNKIQEVFDLRDDILTDIFEEEDKKEIERRLSKEYDKRSAEYGVSKEEFLKEAYRRYDYDEEEINSNTLRCDEYKAFCGDDIDEYAFKTTTVEVPKDFAGLISNIKLVNKLREVLVLQGFRRILPATESDVKDRTDMGLFDEDYSPLSKEPLNWLPAIELFGEGIFIEFNEDAVSKWEKNNKDRYKVMGQRHQGSWIGNGMFDPNNPRYVLLHTFSHLLINQLSAQCGYATASIKEKIYSTLPDQDTTMCGVLIYTSASDTDGSLGGLVREGNTDKIELTLKNMLQESTWCSNDPICIDSKNQGFKGLNYAACHACALLPETSCESLNCLLDRAAITGTPENPEIAYFKNLL